MKKFKKVMVGAVAATLAVSSLTGCGNDKEKETETEKKTEKESETATVETTEKETTKSGESEEFLIGGMGPLTGAAASYGNSVKQGAEIAIEEINAAGGVTVGDVNYTLALAFEDDEAT